MAIIAEHAQFVDRWGKKFKRQQMLVLVVAVVLLLA
jgi:hypothetical protein